MLLNWNIAFQAHFTSHYYINHLQNNANKYNRTNRYQLQTEIKFQIRMNSIDYYLYVLQQVSFDERLFQKELVKALSSLYQEERNELKEKLTSTFAQFYPQIEKAFRSVNRNPANELIINDLCIGSFHLHQAFLYGLESKIQEEAGNMIVSVEKLLSENFNTDHLLLTATKNLKRVHFENDLRQQLKFYSKLSVSLYRFLKVTHIPESINAFFQYCPVSLSQQGAFWISDSKKIVNPYSLVESYSCGRLIAQI